MTELAEALATPLEGTRIAEGVELPEKLLQSGDDADNTLGAVLGRLNEMYGHAERHIGERDGETLERLTKEARAEALKGVGNPEDPFGKEIREQLLAGRPEAPGDYQADLPEDLTLPEGVEFAFDAEDPLLGWWRSFAHERGLTQAEFTAGLGEYVKATVAGMDPAAEIEKLGERGQERVDAVETKLRSLLDEDQFAAVQRELSGSAKLVEALEVLTTRSAGPPGRIGSPLPASDQQALRAELDKLKNSRAYWNGDNATHERVKAIHEKLAGGKKVVLSANG